PDRSTRARWQQQPRRSVLTPRRSKGGVMSARRVGATTRRLLEQFRRDRRTLALLFIAPIVILGLLGYLIRGSQSVPAVGIANEDPGLPPGWNADRSPGPARVRIRIGPQTIEPGRRQHHPGL